MRPENFRPELFFLIAAVLLIPAFSAPATALTLTPGDSSGGIPTIANGDSVYINGIATGNPPQGLQVWLIGTNYVKTATVSVAPDSTYSYQLRPADTMQLAAGQYVVLVQHPMMNGQFDVYYNPSDGKVYNRLTGMSIFQLTGPGSLDMPASANALMQAIGSQNIDDTFAKTSFYVSTPAASISPIGDHAVGDSFTISGTTNLAAGNNLLVEIRSASFAPTSKNAASGSSGASGTVTVVAGSGSSNRWSFDVDTAGWKPDEYLVTVSGVTIDVTGSASFSLRTAVPTPGQTIAKPSPSVAAAITQETPVPATTPATTPVATKAPFSQVAVIGAIGVLLVSGCLKRKP